MAGGRSPYRAAIVDDDGNVLREGAHQKHDPGPRDPDLMTNTRDPVSSRRRDIDPVAVDRVVYGKSPLLEVTPCDRVEAVSRLRRNHPDWSHEDIGVWVGTTPDVVEHHDKTNKRYRYGWLTRRRGSADGD